MVSLGMLVGVFTLVCLALLAGLLILSWLVRPINNRKKSEQTYECGFPAEGERRAIGFGYLQFAFLFLIFDLAALYLYLYAILPEPPGIVTTSFMLGILTLILIIMHATRSRRYHVA